jgi:hypothetical protein
VGRAIDDTHRAATEAPLDEIRTEHLADEIGLERARGRPLDDARTGAGAIDQRVTRGGVGLGALVWRYAAGHAYNVFSQRMCRNGGRQPRSASQRSSAT